jgi:hypothetical protein
MDVLSSLCGFAQSKEGHPGNAELKSRQGGNLPGFSAIRQPYSAFSGTRHFDAYAELGISVIPSPRTCSKPGSTR